MKRWCNIFYLGLLTIATALMASGCAGLIEPAVARHEQDISALQQSTQEINRSLAALRKTQAERTDELDSIRQNLQTLQGSAEQNTLKLDRSLAEARSLQNEIIAVLKEKDEQLSVLHNRLQVLESGAGIASAPMAKKPANSVSGNGIENVWSPSPYSALAKKQAAGTGQPAPRKTLPRFRRRQLRRGSTTRPTTRCGRETMKAPGSSLIVFCRNTRRVTWPTMHSSGLVRAILSRINLKKRLWRLKS